MHQILRLSHIAAMPEYNQGIFLGGRINKKNIFFFVTDSDLLKVRIGSIMLVDGYAELVQTPHIHCTYPHDAC